MHVIGKVLVWFTFLGVIGAVMLSAKTLQVRNSYLAPLKKYKDSAPGNKLEITKKQEQLDQLNAERDRALLNWSQYWTGIKTTVAGENGGVLTEGMGTNTGLDRAESNNEFPVVHGFALAEDGTSQFVGSFQVIDLLENAAELRLTAEPRPGATEAWRNSENWRWRQNVPSTYTVQMTDLRTQLTFTDEKLLNENKNLEKQQELLAEAEEQLGFRKTELTGGEGTEGLLQKIAAENQVRNQTLLSVDQLRRELKNSLDLQEKLIRANNEAVRALPTPKPTVAKTISKNN